jgi:hypothetical protein
MTSQKSFSRSALGWGIWAAAAWVSEAEARQVLVWGEVGVALAMGREVGAVTGRVLGAAC